jgi:hypothetical protein
MELERSWSRKKMELQHSTAAGLSVLLRPRVGGSVSARGGCAKAAGPEQTPSSPPRTSSSSILSAAVQEMLAASKRSAAAKRPRGPCHPPGPGDGAGAESQGSCATKAEVVVAPAVLPTARTRQALARRVAWRMLLRRRGASPPSLDHGGTKVVLTCCCERLPPGLHCALHQRGRSWTRDGGGTRGWAFSEYARWRIGGASGCRAGSTWSAPASARGSGLHHGRRCWSSGR